MTFPGLAAGRDPGARVPACPRAAARSSPTDSEPLAIGPRDARQYPQGTPFALITGFVRTPQSGPDLARREALGWGDSEYGQAGLERSLDPTLSGRPGIRLVARRPTAAPASSPGTPGATRTTSRPRCPCPSRRRRRPRWATTSAASSCSTPRPAAFAPPSGNALTGLQPPGSTFKTVTASAGAGVGQDQPGHPVPVREVPRDQRVQAEELPQGAVRRLAGERLRAELQLGVRAAGGRRRRQADERHGGALRVQPDALDPLRRAGQRLPARRVADQRPAARRHRHRPGRRGGHAAADGVGRPGDRERRDRPPAVPRPAADLGQRPRAVAPRDPAARSQRRSRR